MSDRTAAFIGWLTWALVAVLPILAGMGVRRAFPGSPAFVPWLVGVLLFAVCFVLAEGIWRVLKTVATLGRSEPAAPHATPDALAAELVSHVLTRPDVRPAWVLTRWPREAENPLVAEALALLEECADLRRQRFDQEQINLHLGTLNHLLNQLRR